MEAWLKILKDHYEDPFHCGGCEHMTHAAELRCEATGCELRMELALGDDVVIDAWFSGDGCAVCEGFASLVVERLTGESQRVAALQGTPASDVSEWLTRLAVPPLLQFAEPASLLAATASQACFVLPLQALAAALVSPVSDLADDLTDATQFGGPSLREEC